MGKDGVGGSSELAPAPLAIQIVLAQILEVPEQQIMPFIQERFPGRDITFYGPVITGTRELIHGLLGSLQKPSDTDPSPTLLDRLSFCWRFLRQADVLVRKTKKADIPVMGGVQHAAAVFRNILPVPLQEPLLRTLLNKLRVGEDARYLHHYCAFRWAKPSSELPPPFERIGKTANRELLRTLIWWCIRSRREMYVEVRPKEPVRVEFAFVVGQVLQDLNGWCGPSIETFPEVDNEVENEFNAWLRYSRLDPTLEDPRLLSASMLKSQRLSSNTTISRRNSWFTGLELRAGMTSEFDS